MRLASSFSLLVISSTCFLVAQDIPLTVEKSIVVTFPTEPNKSYHLFASSNPGPTTWSSVQNGIQGTGGEVTVFYKSDSDQKLFFKVEASSGSSGQQSLLSNAKQSLLSQARLDLTGRDLTDYNLAGADMSHFNFRSARLDGADLSGGNLDNASLDSASLKLADLSGIHFTDLGAWRANFYGADLQGSSFLRANLYSVDFRAANLSGVTFEQSILELANLAGQNLSNRSLKQSYFDSANLTGCDLSGSNLQLGSLRGASISPATLFTGANLESSILDYLHLKNRDLRSVNLRGATIHGSDWSGVNASGNDLTFLVMGGATKAVGANFSNSIMEGVFGSVSSLPGSLPVDLSGANFRNAKLRGASLAGAILVNADLTGADLSFANLSGANLTGATGFDSEQPGIIFGDGDQDYFGNYSPLSRTLLPDGNYKTGTNPGTPLAPSSAPSQLNFSLEQGDPTSQIKYTFSGDKYFLNSLEKGRFKYTFISGTVAVLQLIPPDGNEKYNLLFDSPTSGRLFRSQINSAATSLLIGTFTIP